MERYGWTWWEFHECPRPVVDLIIEKIEQERADQRRDARHRKR